MQHKTIYLEKFHTQAQDVLIIKKISKIQIDNSKSIKGAKEVTSRKNPAIIELYMPAVGLKFISAESLIMLYAPENCMAAKKKNM